MMTTSMIFDGQHYSACAMGDGSLVVTHKRKQGGKRLTGAYAATWIDAIKTAIDASEASALCRAVTEKGA